MFPGLAILAVQFLEPFESCEAGVGEMVLAMPGCPTGVVILKLL
jgi:hypothetical protein